MKLNHYFHCNCEKDFKNIVFECIKIFWNVSRFCGKYQDFDLISSP